MQGQWCIDLMGTKQILPPQSCCISLLASLINRSLWANGSAHHTQHIFYYFPTYKNSSQGFGCGIWPIECNTVKNFFFLLFKTDVDEIRLNLTINVNWKTGARKCDSEQQTTTFNKWFYPLCVFTQGYYTFKASGLMGKVAQGALQISSRIYTGDAFHSLVTWLYIR